MAGQWNFREIETVCIFWRAGQIGLSCWHATRRTTELPEEEKVNENNQRIDRPSSSSGISSDSQPAESISKEDSFSVSDDDSDSLLELLTSPWAQKREGQKSDEQPVEHARKNTGLVHVMPENSCGLPENDGDNDDDFDYTAN